MEDIKVNISLISSDNNSTQILFEGESINYITVNTLKRIMMSDIPTYGFYKSHINIEKNTSIAYDNDQVRSRLMMLPVMGIIPQVKSLKMEYYPYVSGSYGSIVPDHPEVKDPKDKLDLQFYLQVDNKSDGILNVTTNDFVIRQNGEEIDNIYDEKEPILLIKLKPHESIKLQMIPNLGIARLNQCWSVGHCFYEEEGKHKYPFTLEPLGNLDAFTIFDRACDIFIEKLKNIQEDLSQKKNDLKENKINLKFDHEDHTLGNCLSYALQIHKKSLNANYKMDHPQIRRIEINVESESTAVFTIINDAINYLIELYQEIQKQIAKLNKSGKKEKVKKSKKK